VVSVTHLLDTNVCIEILRGRGGSILAHLESCIPGSVAVSTVTVGELAFGARLSRRPEESGRVARLLNDFVIRDFDASAAWEYGEIRHELHRSGQPIGNLDLLIAAIARANNYVLVTHNRNEFARIQRLKLEAWQT
jgi:tRNA(fMet)-specific endonuclease VapC